MTKKVISAIILIGAISFFVIYIKKQNSLIRPLNSQVNSIAVLQSLNSKFSNVGDVFENQDRIIATIGKWQVIFSRNKDLELQVRALQDITTGLRMDKDKSYEIDLRFDKAVIKQL